MPGVAGDRMIRKDRRKDRHKRASDGRNPMIRLNPSTADRFFAVQRLLESKRVKKTSGSFVINWLIDVAHASIQAVLEQGTAESQKHAQAEESPLAMPAAPFDSQPPSSSLGQQHQDGHHLGQRGEKQPPPSPQQTGPAHAGQQVSSPGGRGEQPHQLFQLNEPVHGEHHHPGDSLPGGLEHPGTSHSGVSSAQAGDPGDGRPSSHSQAAGSLHSSMQESQNQAYLLPHHMAPIHTQAHAAQAQLPGSFSGNGGGYPYPAAQGQDEDEEDEELMVDEGEPHSQAPVPLHLGVDSSYLSLGPALGALGSGSLSAAMNPNARYGYGSAADIARSALAAAEAAEAEGDDEDEEVDVVADEDDETGGNPLRNFRAPSGMHQVLTERDVVWMRTGRAFPVHGLEDQEDDVDDDV